MTARPQEDGPGNVIRLHPEGIRAVPPAGDDGVIEGTVVTRELVRLPPVEAIRAAVAHRHARTAARNIAYLGIGCTVAARRAWESRTTARYDRNIRAAEQGGAREAALEWEERKARFLRERHARRMAWAQLAQKSVHAAPKAFIVAAGILTLAGALIAWGRHNPADIVWPFEFIAWLTTAVVVVASVTWGWVLAAGSAVAALLLWRAGKKHAAADLPPWLMTAAQREDHEGAPVTPSVLITALRDLGIPALRKAIQAMEDGAAQMLSLITSAGCGIEVDVYLPSGVATSEIIARREKLAENVGRHKHELFITIPGRPRTVRLWIADSGALDEPIGPSPLVTDRTVRADYRTGRAPWGQNLRGEPSTVSVFQRHVLVTGISNHGKTAALRALALWLSLSPRVRFQVADFKGTGDWNMFDGLAEVLIQGPTDEHVAAGTRMAEAGVAEMQDRTALMQELTAQGWTQEKILADPRFDPLVLVFDEAQKAYGCGADDGDGRPYGGTKNTSRYFQAIKAIHDQGRAVCVTTWEGTQDPTNENLPKRTREGNHIRASLVVGTEAQAAMALGENAVAAGAAPHELRQGADKGVIVVAGDVTAFDAPRGQTFTIIRTHLIGDKDAAAVAARAVKLRGGRVQSPDATAATPRDLLADIAAVTRDHAGRVRLSDLPARLRKLDRHWEPYKSLNATQLREMLDDAGVRVTNTGNVLRLDPARLPATAREQAILTGESDDAPPADAPVIDRELLAAAAELVITPQFASVSMLNRKLRVPFDQAETLMELLEDRGIVSGPDDGGNRDVLKRPGQLEEVIAAIRSELGPAGRVSFLTRPRRQPNQATDLRKHN